MFECSIQDNPTAQLTKSNCDHSTTVSPSVEARNGLGNPFSHDLNYDYFSIAQQTHLFPLVKLLSSQATRAKLPVRFCPTSKPLPKYLKCDRVPRDPIPRSNSVRPSMVVCCGSGLNVECSGWYGDRKGAVRSSEARRYRYRVLDRMLSGP